MYIANTTLDNAMKYLQYILPSTTGEVREHAVAMLDEALRYKPKGRGFDSRRIYWNFSFI
jgi:hypothetical protein